MKYSEFQHILSGERLQRYLLACDNNTRKTMTLYRLNLNLSQEVFTLLSCFEVAVRNAIDRILTERLGENWLRDAVLDGGCRDGVRGVEVYVCQSSIQGCRAYLTCNIPQQTPFIGRSSI